MPKKKIKARKPKTRKKRITAKRAKAKSVTEQIDAFDWRDVKTIRVGSGMVGRKANG